MQFARVVVRDDRRRRRRRPRALRLGDRRRRRLRRPRRRAVRALPALRRPRGHAGPARRVRAAQPGRQHAAVRAAAGGGGGRAGDREPGGRAGRRAAARPCSAARRRCSSSSSWRSARRSGSTRSPPSGTSRWPSSCVRLGLIYAGLADRPGARAGLDERVGKYAWTGLVSQAGITLGFASVRGGGVSRLGHADPDAARRASSPSTSSSGRSLFRQGLARAGELDAHEPRPLVVVSNREPYLHTEASDGAIVASAATGGVAVALDALMRERGGVWIAHGAGPADRLVVDAADKVRVPPEQPVLHAAPALARGADVLRLLRRVRQRRALAALPPRRRAAEVPRRGLGGLPGRQRALRRGGPRGARHDRRARLHPGLSPGARGAGALRTRRPDAQTALFWHIPWPYPGSPPHLSLARARSSTGLLANDLLAFQLERDRGNFLRAVEEELDAEVETRIVARPLRRAIEHDRRLGPDRRRLRPHPGDRRRSVALPHEQQRLREAVRTFAPRSSASASIGSTTPRASPNASPRSTRS